MKRRWIFGSLGLLLLVGGVGWYFHHAGQPRRTAIQALTALSDSLQAGNSARLLQSVAIPATIRDRTAAEQSEFLAKALREEISEEGLRLLEREGEFGSLTNLFPSDGVRWAEQAGVRPEDCVAFKLERNGLRTEVVLVQPSTFNSPPSTAFQIVRCNNVKQLTPVPHPIMEKP